MGFLLWMGRRFKRRLKDGDIFLTYLVIYPVGRFFLEFLRLDASMVGGINANQTFMAIVALCAGAALFLRHRNDKQIPAEPEQLPEQKDELPPSPVE
jgi:phosphatidylglycerol:prolipoprotein diacylglycerol transferase